MVCIILFTVWPCVGWCREGKLYSADSFVFAIELFIWAAKLFSSLSASFLFLSVFPDLSVWLNTTLVHVHLLSSLCPVLTLSSSHILFLCPFLLPLSDPSVPHYFFYLFLQPTTPHTFPLSFFNLDFHLRSVWLAQTPLSFYFFWWQSLFFTSPSLSHPVSVHCLSFSLSPWLTDSWFSSINIPPGWLDFTMCQVSPHQKANNEKRNVWRNPAMPLHVKEKVEEE